jgi:two-component system phosphate regulon sensor histidine kinase PhoR
VIDANVLEIYLKTEFALRNINIDYEYGIYDCSTDRMVYGNYVSADTTKRRDKIKNPLPKYSEYIYYFGVNFPAKHSYLINQMGIWVFSSAILFLLIVFFTYTLFVIFRQKRLSEIQKDFINNMTHEFKTPISTIAISADVIMQKETINNPQRLLNYASIIKEENERLRSQVERVLQMASIEKHEFKLKKEKLDVHEEIKKVVQNFDETLKKQQAVVHFEFKATHSLIEADRIHFVNVIYNLLDNALKYTNKTPEIIFCTESNGKQLLLRIKDNGIGIAPEFQKQVFDKFFRVPTGNIHNVKGFGLGLDYVKNIVKSHKWKIKLNSETGKWTEFVMVISLTS